MVSLVIAFIACVIAFSTIIGVMLITDEKVEALFVGIWYLIQKMKGRVS